MNKPKYQIGDRISKGRYVIRGVAPLKNGDYRYFIQVANSDNTLIASSQDVELNANGLEDCWQYDIPPF